MHSHSIRESQEACFHGCFSAPSLSFSDTPKPTFKSINTVAASHYDFDAATAASLFPNTQFTNHESLPSLSDALSRFTTAYPLYSHTHEIDQIRAQHYFHLSLYNHVCFDYIGLGLFSYSQQQIPSSTPSSSPTLSPNSLQFPFFDISYKPTSLHSQILNRGKGSEFESRIKKRIMDFLNLSETDYHMVFTANRESAFKLLAESYPFQSKSSLLTVYDYNSEGVRVMIDNSQKRGAQVMSAKFSWPSLRIHPKKLTNLIVGKGKKKRKRGLFVFPLQSRMTGRRYSYHWMSLAQENGWHVLLDACALGPKDMDSLGLSLFRPDFLICSFFKVFGENPSGFGCLFIKRSSASVLEASTTARSSLGIVTLVPANNLSQLPTDDSDNHPETQEKSKLNELERVEHGDASEPHMEQPFSSEIEELDKPIDLLKHGNTETNTTGTGKKSSEINCEYLDHADSLGLTIITSRARHLTNWLVNALINLRHPYPEQGLPLVRIYGPKIKFNRGPALAFNVFDWKGEKVEPVLVQKLGDRSNISISCGFLHNIWFSDKYEEEKESVLETRNLETTEEASKRRKERVDMGITVVTAAVGFLVNFEDIYRLWGFIAQFLDADFVVKERWRYTTLNQKTIEV
ncbi:molybdenum cofactor sulfurase [Telopea speciosissima]|uniref:molybdenum cofactor sulfurase n=1 Tax=Telopea speciosissima TaxID=54955 RepID=UPI001CC8235F|nr:molybdenum cofactor sulfurase [Telopea speciosissima]